MRDNWRYSLRLKLEDFVEPFVVKGAMQSDVYDAIVDEVGNLRQRMTAIDPSEDQPSDISEPANDWPGAEK